MQNSRRRFIAGSAASACLLLPGTGAEKPALAAAPDGPACLDYGRSFICNQASFNSVRFWVESRTTLIDGDKPPQHFYQCGACKSENTFAEKDLFHTDNYDFTPILGDKHWLIFRRPARLSPDYRRIQTLDQVWGEPAMKIRETRATRRLETWDQIREATAAGVPIVSQTELHDETTGLRAIVECPVKTLNVSIDNQKYQTDTGPVGYPDLSRRYEIPIDCLRLAFVAFNAPDFADFIVEQPTPLIENEQAVGQIYHYSQPFSVPAKNTLLALEGLS